MTFDGTCELGGVQRAPQGIEGGSPGAGVLCGCGYSGGWWWWVPVGGKWHMAHWHSGRFAPRPVGRSRGPWWQVNMSQRASRFAWRLARGSRLFCSHVRTAYYRPCFLLCLYPIFDLSSPAVQIRSGVQRLAALAAPASRLSPSDVCPFAPFAFSPSDFACCSPLVASSVVVAAAAAFTSTAAHATRHSASPTASPSARRSVQTSLMPLRNTAQQSLSTTTTSCTKSHITHTH
jgi:hypothetical protein